MLRGMESLQRRSSFARRQIRVLPEGFEQISIAPIMEFPTVGEAHRRRVVINVRARLSAVGSKNSSCWIQPRQFSRGFDPARAVLDRNAA
jgi:hypothetical protein